MHAFLQVYVCVETRHHFNFTIHLFIYCVYVYMCRSEDSLRKSAPPTMWALSSNLGCRAWHLSPLSSLASLSAWLF